MIFWSKNYHIMTVNLQRFSSSFFPRINTVKRETDDGCTCLHMYYYSPVKDKIEIKMKKSDQIKSMDISGSQMNRYSHQIYG